MRKTIYVSNLDDWNRICLAANEGGVSVSKFILGAAMGLIGEGVGQLDRIERKLDGLLSGPSEGGGRYCSGTDREHEVEFPDPVTEDAKIEAANERLKKKRAEKNVSEPVWSGGYSKDKQLGKKSKFFKGGK